MIGKKISKYKIISILGEGGMGKVYLAEDTQLKRKVALKFLHSQYTKDKKIKAMFKQEALVMAAINHPNIITIYEVGDFRNSSYIAMEYIDGTSLDTFIKKNKTSFKQILDYSIQICEGLNEAHKAGIIHRDIKPGNIRLGKKGNIKILDFGLAKLKEESRKTSKSTTIGTLYYLSPEQLSGSPVDHRADIFSFGVLLYELITGILPFTGEYEAEVIYSILNEHPEPMARYKAGVSESLQRIVDKALEKNIDMRYQHIDDLIADLKNERIFERDRNKDAAALLTQKKESSETIRKLVAIMFIDIVGFSQMMGQNEDLTLKLLDDYDKLVAPLIKHYSGIILKKLGDGLFCEFSSAVGAVNCAIQIQGALKEYNQKAKKDFSLLVRIGIHMGDVVKKQDDSFGDGVNVAARLEPHAPPGGICISETIYSAVCSHPQFDIFSLGQRKLKNITHKYHLYQVKSGYEVMDDEIRKVVLSTKLTTAGFLDKALKLVHPIRLSNKLRISIYSILALSIIVTILIFTNVFNLLTPVEKDLPSDDKNVVDQETNAIHSLNIQNIEYLKLSKSQKFIHDIRNLNNEQDLILFLQNKQREGALTYGKQNDFFNQDNKFVVIFNESEIKTVLLYHDKKFVDPDGNKIWEDLMPAFTGDKVIWIELF